MWNKNDAKIYDVRPLRNISGEIILSYNGKKYKLKFDEYYNGQGSDKMTLLDSPGDLVSTESEKDEKVELPEVVYETAKKELKDIDKI